MKLKNEVRQIPQWFENFELEKLYQHPVKEVKHLIWCLQATGVLSLVIMMVLGITLLITGGGHAASGLFALVPCVSIACLQVIVLGIQAESKFAWLLCFSLAVSGVFSLALPLSIFIFYFLKLFLQPVLF